jgi:hypothetical protein
MIPGKALGLRRLVFISATSDMHCKFHKINTKRK